MANVIIQRTWPDSDELTVSIEVDEFHPDVLDQARSAAVATYRDALGLTLTGNGSEES